VNTAPNPFVPDAPTGSQGEPGTPPRAPFVQAWKPRTCEELGICQGRYPACGRCDDDYSDEEISLTPMEQIGYWSVLALMCAGSIAVVGFGVGYLHSMVLGV